MLPIESKKDAIIRQIVREINAADDALMDVHKLLISAFNFKLDSDASFLVLEVKEMVLCLRRLEAKITEVISRADTKSL